MKISRCCTLFVLSVILLFQNYSFSQITHSRPENDHLIYKVFCVGNTGAGSEDALASTLQLLQNKLSSAGSSSTVIFLGDLLPNNGMPDLGDVDRREAEQRLKQLTDAVINFEGRIFFVPGEHDWGIKKKKGWKSLLRMENFIEKTLDRGDVFVPSNGFPGPEHIKLTDKIRLIALNTQWLLTESKKQTGDYGDYDIKEDDDFYVALEDMIMRRATKDLIIVGHHPLYSNGRYGGHFNPNAHLFPLTQAWENAYLPLPIIGTASLAIRRNIGDEQYFSDRRNLWMRQNIDNIIRQHEDFIYVSAHDYSQQLFNSRALSKMQNYLISGAASTSEYAVSGHKTAQLRPDFISTEKGFSSLNFYKMDPYGLIYGQSVKKKAGKYFKK